MSNTPDRPVLLTFAMMTNQATAEAYIYTEARKVTRRLLHIFDDYDRTDWPLLILILEMYAAKVYEILPPEDRRVADRLRPMLERLKEPKQEGGQ